MKWTKQQKIAAGVLCLAAAAFGADRVFFASPPDDAIAGDGGGAATSAAVVASGGTAAGPRAGGAAGGQSAALLAQRLEQVAAAEGIRSGRTPDAFGPPAAWFAGPERLPARAPTAAAPAVDRAAEFRARHKLTAVMRGGPRPGQAAAVLTGPAGGVTVRVGQSVDGFVLTTVRDAVIVLTDGRQEVELELAKPGLGTAMVAP